METKVLTWFDNPRLLRRSYSSFQTTCSRKAFLGALGIDVREATVDTAFGHAFGSGVQAFLETGDIETAVWEAWLAFSGDEDLLADDKKQKSIYFAVDAVQRFAEVWTYTYADRYKPLFYNGKAAKELSFKIVMPDGHYYIGFIDFVLIDTYENKLVTLELKTTGQNRVDEAMYANSSQGVGYGVVLDKIASELDFDGSSWQVFYLSYLTKSQEFAPLPFVKTAYDRAQFLQDLWMKFTVWNFYKEQKHFPKNGDSCLAFGRRCEFFGRCDMSPDSMLPAWRKEVGFLQGEEPEKYDFEFDFSSLVANQQELLGV